MSVTHRGDMRAHGLLGPRVKQQGRQLLRARTQDLGPDKPYLVSTENVHDAGILFPQTLLTVTSSNQEIGGLGDVGDAFQETQSDPIQKAVSVI